MTFIEVELDFSVYTTETEIDMIRYSCLSQRFTYNK